MTVLRCTAKLLKRLKHAAKLAEPVAETNPLGEWYADIDVWRRQSFVVMINARTGAVLALTANAAGLRVLHEKALLQFAALCEQHGLRGAGVDAELHGFDAGFTCANTSDRSLLSTLSQRKYGVWLELEHSNGSLHEAAAREWNGLFQHPALGRCAIHNMEYHRPLDLLRHHLMPVALPTNEP